jgi:hypothetical protein
MPVSTSKASNADKPEKRITTTATYSMANADEPETRTAQRRSIPSLFHIGLAFATVFLPLVLVATLLCLFVTLPIWTIYNPPEEHNDLPIPPLNNSVFLTAIYSNKVTLTSSFASNIAQFAASPFLLLFSFLVALELSNRQHAKNEDTTKLLHGDHDPVSILLRMWRVRNTRRAKGTRIAGIGALLSILITYVFDPDRVKIQLVNCETSVLLLIAGNYLQRCQTPNSKKLTVPDKLLQGTVGETSQRVFESNYYDPDSDGSFTINGTLCPVEEIIPDIYDNRTAPPCSIEGATTPWTLYGAPSAYRILASGLLNQTGDYHKEDFDALSNSSDSGIFSWTQLITHYDLATEDQHVYFFDPSWAEEGSDKQKPPKMDLVNNDLDRFGLDFIANTTSIVTKCVPITADCGMRNVTGNDTSIPYHCSDIFNGDLNEIPTNGLERLKGWNSMFYNTENGVPRNISVASQLNPFYYNVTAVVDSINIGGLVDFRDPQALAGNIVGIGDARVAFAISCNSTVYDVTYALVDGNIHVFNKTLADPRTAAIVKAPLQAGFGSYSLFEKAAVSVLFSNLTVMDSMELAFSQTFLALASGVYARAPILQQRWRADMTLTQLGKGPFYFLVICMFLYAFVVLVFTVIALSIFRRNDVQEVQVQLMPKE